MLRDAVTMFRYRLELIVQEPIWVVIVMVQPLLYMALFAPLLGPIASAKGFPPGDAWQVFVPGLLVQLGIFGNLFVGFGLVADIRYGVLERMRVSPASMLGLVLGRIMVDTLVVQLQSTVLVAIAIALGLHVSALGAVVAIGIVGVLGIGLSALSYAAGLWLENDQSLAKLLNTVSLPLVLLSGILLPMSLAPAWLSDLSLVNPLRHVVDATRAAVLGDFGEAVLRGSACAAVVAAFGLWLAERVFRRNSG